MIGAKMDHKVELVARAFYKADQKACLWDNEPAVCKEQFREFARNVINLVNEDISVLLPASENASAEERVRSMR
jgi:hypothetical protein